MNQSAKEAIALLPTVCDRGVKKNAKGYTETWNGFKLHIDVNDCGLPLSAVLTSASVHDSQVAIPLMKLTSSKVTYCYDLMDAAYDAAQIWDQSRELGHVPIIDRNPRGKEVIPWRRMKLSATTSGQPRSGAIADSRKISADAMSWFVVPTR